MNNKEKKYFSLMSDIDAEYISSAAECLKKETEPKTSYKIPKRSKAGIWARRIVTGAAACFLLAFVVLTAAVLIKGNRGINYPIVNPGEPVYNDYGGTYLGRNATLITYFDGTFVLECEEKAENNVNDITESRIYTGRYLSADRVLTLGFEECKYVFDFANIMKNEDRFAAIVEDMKKAMTDTELAELIENGKTTSVSEYRKSERFMVDNKRGFTCMSAEYVDGVYSGGAVSNTGITSGILNLNGDKGTFTLNSADMDFRGFGVKNVSFSGAYVPLDGGKVELYFNGMLERIDVTVMRSDDKEKFERFLNSFMESDDSAEGKEIAESLKNTGLWMKNSDCSGRKTVVLDSAFYVDTSAETPKRRLTLAEAEVIIAQYEDINNMVRAFEAIAAPDNVTGTIKQFLLDDDNRESVWVSIKDGKYLEIWYTCVNQDGEESYNEVLFDATDQGTSRGLTYVSNGDGTCYVSGIGSCTDNHIVIPTLSLDGDAVTAIGSRAFEKQEQITSVVIPSSVTRIEEGAFLYCKSLASVTFPEGPEASVYIGIIAFGYCPLETLVIPGSVKYIDSDAFSPCCKEVILLDGVEELGSHAFEINPLLEKVVIPKSVTRVGQDQFFNCPNVTVYCEAESKPSGWSEYWNISGVNVVWGKTPDD